MLHSFMLKVLNLIIGDMSINYNLVTIKSCLAITVICLTILFLCPVLSNHIFQSSFSSFPYAMPSCFLPFLTRSKDLSVWVSPDGVLTCLGFVLICIHLPLRLVVFCSSLGSVFWLTYRIEHL